VDAFSIECTTCHKRLKVRDASTIGEILICPSCGSMVLVEAPEGFYADTAEIDPPPTVRSPVARSKSVDRLPVDDVAGSDAPEDSTPEDSTAVANAAADTAVAEGADAGAGNVAEPAEVTAPPAETAEPKPPPVTEPPSTSTTPPPTPLHATPPPAVQAPPGLDSPDVLGPVADPSFGIGSPGPAAADPDASPPDSSAPPMLPTDDWLSPQAHRRRQWLLISAAACIGILLALGAVGILVTIGGRSSDGEPSDSALRDDATSEPGSGLRETTEASPDGVDSGEPDAKPAADATAKPSDPPEGAEPPVEATENVAASKAEPTTADIADRKPDGGVSTPESTDPAAETEMANSTAGTEDPPQLSQESSGPGESGGTAATEEPSTDSMLSDPLRKFDAYLNTKPFKAPPPADIEPAEGLPSDTPELAAEGTAPRPAPRQVDVARHLQDPLAEIRFESVPLTRVLRFVTDFSTIPITLDPDALILLDLAPTVPVSVTLSETDVAGLLQATLAPLQLTALPVGDQLLATRPILPDGQLRQLRLQVDDLVGEGPQAFSAFELGNLMTTMIEPESWEDLGGPASVEETPEGLAIYQQDTTLFRCVRFLERLRAARGLRLRTNFDPARFSLQPRWSQADQVLGKSITLSYLQPTLLVDILERLEQESGATILVDWLALADLGWTPDSETTLVASHQPLGQLLDEMLQAMDLAYRVIGPDRIQVTSPEALNARLEVEFYPLKAPWAAGQSPAVLIQRITERLGADKLTKSGGTLYFDAHSQHLIAALPQPQQRVLVQALQELASPPQPKSDP
jgi:hypothetical protein